MMTARGRYQSHQSARRQLDIGVVDKSTTRRFQQFLGNLLFARFSAQKAVQRPHAMRCEITQTQDSLAAA